MLAVALLTLVGLVLLVLFTIGAPHRLLTGIGVAWLSSQARSELYQLRGVL